MVSSVDEWRSELTSLLKAASQAEGKKDKPQDVISEFTLSKMRANSATGRYTELPAGVVRGHELPAATLGKFKDPGQFLAQAGLFVQNLVFAHRKAGLQNDAFFLTGEESLDESQAGTLNELIRQANQGKPFIQFGEAPERFQGVVVKYVATDEINTTPILRNNTLLMPISGVEENELLAWYEAISLGGDLGGVFARHYANGAIDSTKVTADDLNSIRSFYNSRSKQRIDDPARFKALVTGALKDIQILRALSFYLPIRPFNIEARLSAARMLLKQIGISA